MSVRVREILFGHASRALLQEHKVESGARWSKTKSAISGDPRYKAVPREEREKLFNAFLDELDVRPVQTSPHVFSTSLIFSP